MRGLPTVAVALLLVTAGCGGFGGTEDDAATVAPSLRGTPTGTATPTEAPTDTPDAGGSLPPGVTPDADDEVDERTLYFAHGRALEDRSATWRDQRLRTNATGTVLGWSTRTVQTNGSRQRYEIETGGVDPAAVRIRGTVPEYWTNGSVTVSRLVLSDGRIDRRSGIDRRRTEGSPPGAFAYVKTGYAILRDVLTAAELQYVGVERRNGTALHVLALADGSDDRLTVRVTSDGVVRSFVYRTRGRVDGMEVTSVSRFRTYDVGTTVVERPEWVANATG